MEEHCVRVLGGHLEDVGLEEARQDDDVIAVLREFCHRSLAGLSGQDLLDVDGLDPRKVFLHVLTSAVVALPPTTHDPAVVDPRHPEALTGHACLSGCRGLRRRGLRRRGLRGRGLRRLDFIVTASNCDQHQDRGYNDPFGHSMDHLDSSLFEPAARTPLQSCRWFRQSPTLATTCGR